MNDESDWPFGRNQSDFSSGRVALVVVDMQYWDAHPDFGLAPAQRAMSSDGGEYYFTRLEEVVVGQTARLIAACHDYGVQVVHIVSGPETSDGTDLLPRVQRRRREMKSRFGVSGIYRRGSKERDILETLPFDAERDIVLNKITTGAFTSTSLDQILRVKGIQTVMLAGVVTNVCIESTGRQASDFGYSCVIVSDACAAYDDASHQSTLNNFRRFFGDVQTVDDVMASLTEMGQQGIRDGR